MRFAYIDINAIGAICRASGTVYSALEKKSGTKIAIKMCSIDELEQLVRIHIHIYLIVALY